MHDETMRGKRSRTEVTATFRSSRNVRVLYNFRLYGLLCGSLLKRSAKAQKRFLRAPFQVNIEQCLKG